MVHRPELIGDLGAVSSTHWLASGAGMAVLERGGNAVDAAVAAGAVLQVVEPHSNGFGGDLSVVVHSARTGRTSVICGQGPTPAAATMDRFRGLGLTQVPGSGVLPATVPGAFGGWLRLLAEFGTMGLRPVLDAAIGYAGAGFPLLPATARVVAALAPLFRTEWASSGEVYLPGGEVPAPGTRIRNPALAATMARLVTDVEAVSTDRDAQLAAAEDAFYRGPVAEAIDRFVGGTDVLDSTGTRHRGLLTAQDLDGWRATVEDPVAVEFRGHTVYKPGPWTQGPVFLQQLALLDGYDLGSLDPRGAEYLHLSTEAAKVAFADREAWYGDPDRTAVPMAELLSPEYTEERRALIGDRAGSPAPGAPAGRSSWVPTPAPVQLPPDDPAYLGQIHDGLPTVVLAATVKSGDTCTVVVADRAGNLVAAVPSGGWIKSSPVIPELGFSLGTRAQTMWLDEGHPNALGPGVRPRSTLSPTVVLRDGAPHLAFGTPGGDRQDQWTLQAFLAATEFDMDLQAATETLAFCSDHFPTSFTPRPSRPGVLVVERDVDPAVVADLRGRGHDVELVAEASLGKVCMVGADPRPDGFVRAAAGARGRQAYAACR